jgi:hypothetical protein
MSRIRTPCSSLRQLRLGESARGIGEVEVLAGLHAGERVVLDPVKAAIADEVRAKRPGRVAEWVFPAASPASLPARK